MSGKRTILVVDDDPGMRQTIAGILEDEGYTVVCADNGRLALVALEQSPPALVVLDMMMAEMDGATFADELVRRGLRPGLPLIVVTADGRASRRAARIGAEGYLAKPFDLAALVAEVGRHLPVEAP